MRAVEISRPGGPEVLTLAERPLPEPGHGEVRLRLAYAGVNRPDALQRAGAYAPPPSASDLPGLEGAGTVDALGPGVTDLALGEESVDITATVLAIAQVFEAQPSGRVLGMTQMHHVAAIDALDEGVARQHADLASHGGIAQLHPLPWSEQQERKGRHDDDCKDDPGQVRTNFHHQLHWAR